MFIYLQLFIKFVKIHTMSRKYKTNILFPRSSALIGAGSVFNIAGNYFMFNFLKSDEEADRKAIESDWGIVGNDIRKSINKVKSKLVEID